MKEEQQKASRSGLRWKSFGLSTATEKHSSCLCGSRSRLETNVIKLSLNPSPGGRGVEERVIANGAVLLNLMALG